ncbi:MAG: VTT domain-containing protein [Verrucomicrobiae bacterium]|nr:VTT domain-containing protein [Verrucomicrobiae bacterium]
MKLLKGEHFGENARADRLGVFEDTASYFAAAREAILHAEKQVILIGWDFHTKIELLRRSESETGAPTRLGELLEYVLENNDELEIYILIWDFSMVYALEREFQAFSEILKNPHPRLHFRYDNQLPTGASHHQKILVIDDELGFSGGADLSVWRWDTSEHLIDDEVRIDPAGDSFAPYHDVQYVLTGEAQVQLRKICASRWQRATGEELPECGHFRSTQMEFPTGLAAETEKVDVLFASTFSAWESEPEVREIERLHLELIRSATRYLYFENQYFSSNRIGEAILRRVEEPNGPEVVIVLNNNTEGAIEEATLGRMRDYWFRKFKTAGESDRLRTLFPVVQQKEGGPVRVYVHAKILIVDDRVLKMGSANLSNRSMRVDSELDLAIVEKEPSEFIQSVRNHLLAGHLGVEEKEFGNAFETERSLIGAIDFCKKKQGKTLAEITCEELDPLAEELTKEQILDPDEPIDPTYWIRSRIRGGESGGIRKRIIFFGGIAVFMLLLALGFKYGWGDLVDDEVVIGWIDTIQSAPYAPLILGCLFFFAGMVGFPLNAILVVASLSLGPWVAFFSGYLGAHASAIVGFGIGRGFGSRILRKLDSDMVHRIDEMLSRQGIFPVALVRIVPVAPFLIVNLVAGSSRLTQRSFHLGTILGMAPGMLFVSVLSNQVESVITDPGWTRLALLVGLLIILGVVAWFVFKGIAEADSSSISNAQSSSDS